MIQIERFGNKLWYGIDGRRFEEVPTPFLCNPPTDATQKSVATRAAVSASGFPSIEPSDVVLRISKPIPKPRLSVQPTEDMNSVGM